MLDKITLVCLFFSAPCDGDSSAARLRLNKINETLVPVKATRKKLLDPSTVLKSFFLSRAERKMSRSSHSFASHVKLKTSIFKMFLRLNETPSWKKRPRAGEKD